MRLEFTRPIVVLKSLEAFLEEWEAELTSGSYPSNFLFLVHKLRDKLSAFGIRVGLAQMKARTYDEETIKWLASRVIGGDLLDVIIILQRVTQGKVGKELASILVF